MGSNENVILDSFCESKKCQEYHEWETGVGSCVSCRMVGQSYNIDEYPTECLFLEEIKEYEKLQKQPKDYPKRFQLYKILKNGYDLPVKSCQALNYDHARQIFREMDKYLLEFDFDKGFKIEEEEITPMQKFMEENGLG